MIFCTKLRNNEFYGKLKMLILYKIENDTFRQHKIILTKDGYLHATQSNFNGYIHTILVILDEMILYEYLFM